MDSNNKPKALSDRDYFEKTAGYAILDQVADILANRHEMMIEEVNDTINKYGAEELYDRYIGPAIDEASDALELM